MKLPTRLRPLLAIVAALAGAVTFTIAFGDGGQPHHRAHGHAHHEVAPAGDRQAPAGEPNLKDDTPEAVSHGALIEGAQRTRAAGDRLLPVPVGGAQTYSCRESFGNGLYSSRHGIKPTEFVVHYTAGPGTAQSILDFFTRTRAASSTYILEPATRCIQMAPESAKPWTQLAANPYAISVEIVTTGYNLSRAQWLAMPIFSKHVLADLMRDSMRRNGIPLRHVDPVGCNFVPGWTDHNALECGNNHTDVQPSFPYDVLQRQLTDSGAGVSPARFLTARERHHARDRCTTRSRLAHTRRGSGRYRTRLAKARRYKAPVRADMRAIDRAKRHDHRPWAHRHRGQRRKTLAGYYTGKGC